jgi:hypothetical protein
LLTRIQSFAGELELVQRCEQRQHRRQADAEGEELRARHLRPVAVERDRVDVLVGEANGEEADRDQDDAEQRVDGAEVGPVRPGLDRVAEHEVRRVEEEEHEEQHQLALAPQPPVPPAELRPERACEQRHRAEDHAQMDGDVALQVGAGLPLPQVHEPLPGAPAEARVRGERDRHVEVEDLLVEAVLVDGRVEEHERDRRRHQHGGERR